jgi:hypothetical protein
MPFLSGSKSALRLQRLQLSLFLLTLACLVFPAGASAQVTYTGSGAVNFGSQAIGSPSAAQTLTFSFASDTRVGSVQAVTQGATGQDFTNAGTGTCTAGTAYSTGATCTIDAIFKPESPGSRYGAAGLLDSSGNVLAAGYLQGTGVGPMVNFLPGIQSTIVSGLTSPTGIAVDEAGNFFITAGAQVLKETLSGGSYTQSTIYSGQSGSSLLGVAVDGGGNVYFVDNGESNAYKATPSAGGYSITEIASGLDLPLGIADDGNGNVYINNTGTSQLLEETPLATGGYTQSVISTGPYPVLSIAVDGQGNLFMVAATVGRFGPEGVVLENGGIIADTVAATPMGIALDGNGDVYVPFSGGVSKLTPTSDGYTQSNLAIDAANSGVAVDGSGNVYALNGGSILKLDLADPPTLSFAATDVGSTSLQTVTVENIGNAVLNLTGLSYPTDFPEQPGGGTNACTSTTSLNPAGMCNLNIDFTPGSGEGQQGYFEDLTLTDNALNVAGAQQVIQLSGLSPALNVTGDAFSAVVGVEFSGQVASFTDGTNLAAVSSFTASIYWGDGISSGGAITQPGGAGTPYIVNASHLYTSSGFANLFLTNITVSKGQGVNAASGSGTASMSPSPAPAARFLVSAPATTNAGSPFILTVTALDAIGNPTTNYNGSVAFTSSDPLFVNPGTLVLSGGVGQTSVTLKTVGSQTITATDSTNQLSGTSNAITVSLPLAAALTSPTPGSVLGTSQTFTWSTGTGVALYDLSLGTSPGSYNLYNSGHITGTSVSVTGLPSGDGTIFATLWSYLNGVWQNTSYTFITAGPPAIFSPAPGSLLGFSATFTWSPGSGATMSSLTLGTAGPGSSNLYNSGPTAATSATVAGIPTNSATVYARLGSFISGTWTYTNYTYTESPPPTPAALISPTPGSVLGTSQIFTWSTGTDVTLYDLALGTEPGSYNLYNSGHITGTSVTATGLPSGSATIYATLWWYIDGVWQFTRYTFIAAGPPAILSPAPGSVLGFNATFTWSPGSGATMSSLTLGTTGPGSSNIYNSGPTAATSATVAGIPTNSVTVYAQLGSFISGTWAYTNYTYTESPPSAQPVLISPTPGSVLSTSQMFTWSTGTDVTLYDLALGTEPGSYNLYNSGHITETSVSVTGLPSDGATIYATLWSYIDGVWQFTRYTFTEQ